MVGGSSAECRRCIFENLSPVESGKRGNIRDDRVVVIDVPSCFGSGTQEPRVQAFSSLGMFRAWSTI